MNKRILVLCHSYYPYDDANSNVMEEVIKKLEKEGYSIDVLAFGKPHNSDKDSIRKVYRFNMPIFFRNNLIPRTKKVNLLKRIFIGIKHKIAINFICAIKNNPVYLSRQLLKTNKYELMISFSSPFYIQVIASKINRDTKLKWNAVMFDPFFSYFGYSENTTKLLQFENKVYRNCNKLFLEQNFYNYGKQLSIDNKKVYKIGLPNLKLKENIEKRVDSKKCELVYAGSFSNNKVRSFDYFIELINAAGIKTIIFCKYYDENLLSKLNTKNISIQKNKSTDECFAEFRKSGSFLINVGNNVINQFPSKIFDYISSCSPIINLVSTSEDLPSKFLSRYPLYLELSICDSINLNVSKLKNFIDFCDKKTILSNNLIDIYKEKQSDSIMDEFYKSFSD